MRRRVPRSRRTAALSLLALALLAPPAPAAALPAAPTATPSILVRVFTLRYRRADEAALLVGPFLTESGSVIVQSKLNTLTVRDVSSSVARAAQAIASYDLPPRAVSISVTLLKASSEAGAVPPRREVSEEIRGVGKRLKELFNFTGYAPLDSVVVQGIEGDSVAYQIGGQYRLEFLLDQTGDEKLVRLKNLSLERVRREPSGNETRGEILRTSINVQASQPYILGVGRDESASGALFLVFYASFKGPGPGIAGVR